MISVGTQVISTGTVDINQVGKDAITGAISGLIAVGAFGVLKHYADGYNAVAKSMSGFNKAQANLTQTAKAMENSGKAFKAMKTSHNLTQYTINSLKHASANTEFGIADALRGSLKSILDLGASFAEFGLSSGIQELILGWI
ncbi:MAG: hypothetical protein WC907_08375 [Acholeplasmataceae bacterium]